MSAVRAVGLVADDLTGAIDSAVQFAEAGWSARLERTEQPQAIEGPAGDEPTVIALATGVRHASAEEAAAGTAAAVTRLMGRPVDRIFLKIDSTVRGSVAGQVQGALLAWRREHPDAVAVICPAFPALGRTVSGGMVLVHGVPVARSAAADDPVTPVRESRLEVLLPGSVAVGPPWPRRGPLPRDLQQLAFDAEDEHDLARLAELLDGWEGNAVAVGSGGLAQAVANRWAARRPSPAAAPARRVLVVVSSLHPTATRQVARLQAQLADRPDPDLHVLTPPPGRLPPDQAGAVAARLATAAVEHLRSTGSDALLLVGGDGAAAVLDRLQVEAVQTRRALLPGVPDGRIVGGPADGLRLVTKSGGFGDADTLLTLLRQLRAPTPPVDPCPPVPAPAVQHPKDQP